MEDHSIRKCWTPTEVRAFLSCYNARKEEFTHCRKKIYAYGNVLRDLLDSHATTPGTTITHLENKMKALMKAYTGRTSDGSFPISPSPSFQFKAEMDEIFKDQPIVSRSSPKIKSVQSKPIVRPSQNPISSGYCRVCCFRFDPKTPKHSLFDNVGNNLTIIGQMFVKYLFKELEPNNGFFDHLCSECTKKLMDFHTFRCQAFAASKKITELKDKSDPLCGVVKIEDDQATLDAEHANNGNKSPELIKDDGLDIDAPFCFIKLEDTFNNDDNDGLEDTFDSQSVTDKFKGFTCNLCDNQFEFFKDLTNHKRDVHSRCEICHKQLGGLHNLKIHMETVHGQCPIRRNHNEPPIECKMCRRKLRGAANLKQHMDVVHKELMCGLCGEKLYTVGALKRHEARHSVERPFVCNICDKSFRTEYCLKIHHQGHSNYRKYICEICGKKFRNKSHITIHLQAHNSEKYKCGFCDKTFQHFLSRRIHRDKFHLRVNLVTCSLCGKVVHIRNKHVHVKYHKSKGEEAIMQRVPIPATDES